MIKIISRILVRIENRYCRFWAERYYSKHSGVNQKSTPTTNPKTPTQHDNDKQ